MIPRKYYSDYKVPDKALEKLPTIPNGNALSYCRLCFSEDAKLFLMIKSRREGDACIAYVKNIVGIVLTFDEENPFALCDRCCVQLKSIEKFRERCKLFDKALRLSKTADTSQQMETVDQPVPSLAPVTTAGKTGEYTLYPCYACDVTALSEAEYSLHLQKKHPKVDGFIPCTKCEQKFRLYDNFKWHLSIHSGGKHSETIFDASLIRCDICLEVFDSQTEKIQHERTVHKLKFQCGTCHQRFPSKEARTTHKLVHRTYSCKFCALTMPNLATLTKHVQQHGRCLACRSCEKKIPSLNEYISHQRLEHNAPVVVRDLYRCHPCGGVFQNKRSFAQHLNRKHSVYGSTDTSGEIHDESSVSSQGDVEIGMANQQHQDKLGEEIKLECDAEQPTVMSNDYQHDSQESDKNGKQKEAIALGETPNDSMETNEAHETGIKVSLSQSQQQQPNDSGFSIYGSAFRAPHE